MMVPQYWAEGRIQKRVDGRQVTVRRFGWSDSSQQDAQAKADARTQEAFQRIAAGEPLERREAKAAYNGSEGVPIREEIVSRHGEAIVTRNLYGARCLNTPNVLFADIDFGKGPGVGLWAGGTALMLIGAWFIGLTQRSWTYGLMAGALAFLLGGPVAAILNRLRSLAAGGEERRATARLARFVQQHPQWSLRLYRTPAGLRVMAVHRTFDPSEAEVADCFRAWGTDPIYVRMCQNQCCFRARVSPKPWRIGVDNHIRPRPGVWPVNPASLPERTRWIEAYERMARDHASCRFVAAMGSTVLDPTAATVRQLHDELCQANTSLPIA